MNSIQYFISGIKNKDKFKALKIAQELHHFCGTELKELPNEDSGMFLDALNQKIFELVSGKEDLDKIAGIFAIMSQIGINDGTLAKLSPYANYLRNMLPSKNQFLMELVAKAIGYLALSSETYTGEYVDFECRRAFEWLCDDQNPDRRLAAVLVIRELSQCTPSFFMPHLQQFFETIFFAFKDSQLTIRLNAAQSLRAVLLIVCERESKDVHKPPWYQICLNQSFALLHEAQSGRERSYMRDEKLHAGFLILNELLRIGCYPSQFVQDYYETPENLEIYDSIFYKPPVNSQVTLDTSINFLQFQNEMFLGFASSVLGKSIHTDHTSEYINDKTSVLDGLMHLSCTKKQSESCRQLLTQNYDLVYAHINRNFNVRSPFVLSALIELLPRMAFLRPDKFVKSLMYNSMSFLSNLAINVRNKDYTQNCPTFYAMGYIMLALRNASLKRSTITPKHILNNAEEYEINLMGSGILKLVNKVIECVKIALQSTNIKGFSMSSKESTPPTAMSFISSALGSVSSTSANTPNSFPGLLSVAKKFSDPTPAQYFAQFATLDKSIFVCVRACLYAFKDINDPKKIITDSNATSQQTEHIMESMLLRDHLLEAILICGVFSQAWIDCLADIIGVIQSTKTLVCDFLLNRLSWLVINKPYNTYKDLSVLSNSTPTLRSGSINCPYPNSLSDYERLILAIKCLYTFKFNASTCPVQKSENKQQQPSEESGDKNHKYIDYPLLEFVKFVAERFLVFLPTDNSTTLSSPSSINQKSAISHNVIDDEKDVLISECETAFRIECIRMCFSILRHAPSSAYNPIYVTLVFGGHSVDEIINSIVGLRLLPLSCNERRSVIRLAVLKEVWIADTFDPLLKSTVMLSCISMAWQDYKCHEVREHALCLLTRLQKVDPISTTPVLRKWFVQLLTAIRDSGTAIIIEHSMRMLTLLIANSPQVVRLHVLTLTTLFSRLLADYPNGERAAGITVNTLAALGELTPVFGIDESWDLKIFTLVSECMKQTSLSSVREAAIWTLGIMAQSSSDVVSTSKEIPDILDTLAHFMRAETSPKIRYEASRVLGIIGAIDPYLYRLHSSEVSNSNQSQTALTIINSSTINDVNQNVWENETEVDLGSLTGEISINEIWVRTNAKPEDFYPCAVISCLMRIIKDPTLSTHHMISIKLINFILKSLGPKAKDYAQKVLPTFLPLIHSTNDKDFMFQQLTNIVNQTNANLKNYLPQICDIAEDYWNQSIGRVKDSKVRLLPSINLQSSILTLLQALISNMRNDFVPYLPRFLPLFLITLKYDPSPNRNNTQKILLVLKNLGFTIEAYIHIFIPTCLTLIGTPEVSISTRVIVFETLDSFLHIMCLKDYASSILSTVIDVIDHPLSVIKASPDMPSAQPPINAQNAFDRTGSSTLENNMDKQALTNVKNEATKILCSLAYQCRETYLIVFSDTVYYYLAKHNISYGPYEQLITRLGTNYIATFSHKDNSSHSLAYYNDVLPKAKDLISTKSDVPTTNWIVKLNVSNLQKAWYVKGRISKDDWIEWLKKFSLDILKESPSPALRACWALAQNYAMLAKQLFNASFLSCWMDLTDAYQEDLIDNLQYALVNSDVPDIVLSILNLAEFMDHCEKRPLILDSQLLGQQAYKFRAYAKALWYKEAEFHKNASPEILDSLININNRLNAFEASTGILTYAQRFFPHEAETHEVWYENLNQWDTALALYTAKLKIDENNESLKMDSARCMEALGDWSLLLETANNWWPNEQANQTKYASMLCSASWGTSDFKGLEKYVKILPDTTQDGSFYRAVLCINQNESDKALSYIKQCRSMLEPEISVLVSDGPERAYNSIFMAQMLAELEEVVQYKNQPVRRGPIKKIWWDRMHRSQKCSVTWQKMLQIHSLVLPTNDNLQAWLKYVKLCTREKRYAVAERTLTKILGFDPTQQSDAALMLANPFVVASYYKYLWERRDKPSTDVFIKMSTFITDHLQPKYSAEFSANNTPSIAAFLRENDTIATTQKEQKRLLAKCYYTLGQWTEMLNGINDTSIPQIINFYVSAIDNSRHWYKAWHALACTNFEAIHYYKQKGLNLYEKKSRTAQRSGQTQTPPPTLNNAMATPKKIENESFANKDTSKEGSSSSTLNSLPSEERTSSDGDYDEMAANHHSSTSSDDFNNDLDHALPSESAQQDVNAAEIQAPEVTDIPQDLGTLQDRMRKKLHRLTDVKVTTTNANEKDGLNMKNDSKIIPPPTTMVEKNSTNKDANELSINITTTSTDSSEAMLGSQAILHYVYWAVKGFVQSISFSRSATSLQDTLRLLTLCFDYGHIPQIYDCLRDGLFHIRLDNWLQVIPQLLARIDTSKPLVQKLIHQLLIDKGRSHPQAIIYPLTVASKSDIPSRQSAAQKILTAMRHHNGVLVEQALMLSEELIRISIVWHELWHEGLEDASRMYFDKNDRGMFTVLEPLHVILERGPETIKETSFIQAYGRELLEAQAWCQKYVTSLNWKDLDQAWTLYYRIFRKLAKDVQTMVLQLQHVSPKLYACHHLEIAIPGTYRILEVDSGKEFKNVDIPIITKLVKIVKIYPIIQIINSKQKPRKLRILGDDGQEYTYLLKGHEDLRQDERVMQLFGLINNLLRNESETARRNLNITRYAVVPLSTNSGLISWVPHCDTLHTCIKEYRDSKQIPMNKEHEMIKHMAPDYAKLTILQKTEVFRHALSQTKGDDLSRIIWLKCPPNCQEWFERRTCYMRSLAVMSMVGYVLGLGDRHPSNLMLDRQSGKIIHIDFGDCFEVSMVRENYPERVPFRLTRLLVNAMEVPGIDGTYRLTCERVMEVLRAHRDSVMSVLEAFIYDPLINWKFIESDNKAESLNLKALTVIKRVKDKLTGKDFDSNSTCDIKTQVDLLIKQAMSHENLCQMYVGWCPFW